MLFLEILRLILVLLGAVAGLELGRIVSGSHGPVIGMILGALTAYVLGGMVGRTIARMQDRGVERFFPESPGELFAGTLTGIAGMLLGVAISAPLVALVRSPVVWPGGAAVTWIGAWLGYIVGKAKGRQIIAAAGLTRILSPPNEPPPELALLADASALLDRVLLTLGITGLLAGGLVIPRFVVDQVHTLAASPDPVSSRRARRGLESIEALRELGITVRIAEAELPELEDPDMRILEMTRRLGLRLVTSSAALASGAYDRGIRVTDLRHVAEAVRGSLTPGERLSIDLEKEGNQPLQAVGYLPDGDMVVVNEAAHLIGNKKVAVEVLSTRKTAQGMLVFAELA